MNDTDSIKVNQLVHERRERAVDIGQNNKHKSPTQAPKHIKNQTQTRRSPRVPRVTLKYLEGIEVELRDPDEDE